MDYDDYGGVNRENRRNDLKKKEKFMSEKKFRREEKFHGEK